MMVIQFGIFAYASIVWLVLQNLQVCDSFLKPHALITRNIHSVFNDESRVLSANFASVKDDVDVCIIGGGISGLAAAVTIGDRLSSTELTNGNSDHKTKKKIVILEADSEVGGRVRSDVTEDGYVLDRGFAVFIEEYPISKKLLDYDALGLKQFLPGALVKINDRESLVTVADPRRQPGKLFTALTTPLGTLRDKLRLVRLFLHILTNSIDDLFEEAETDTMTLLKEKYGFSDKIISEFFLPFFQGIFFTQLEDQSSRMFHFVLKMFAQGSVALPTGGMQAVSDQLKERAMTKKYIDLDVQTNKIVSDLSRNDDQGAFPFTITVDDKDGKNKKTTIHSKFVIIATDQLSACRLLKNTVSFENLPFTSNENSSDSLQLPQRSVGCIYYSFSTPLPVNEPILVLNGDLKTRNSNVHPIVNVCFPSVVNDCYAPSGFNLCSVSVPSTVLDSFKDQEEDLDKIVREQLGTWFPNEKDNIVKEWTLKRIYNIQNAQPNQYRYDFPANVNGGRNCDKLFDQPLSHGLFVCGDFMSTATFNGALESGVNAADSVCNIILEHKTIDNDS